MALLFGHNTTVARLAPRIKQTALTRWLFYWACRSPHKEPGVIEPLLIDSIFIVD
jgi:hypothetical protein